MGPIGAEQAALFRLVAESTRDMVLIGRPGAPEWVSPSVTELLGYDPETFLAEGTVSLVHPDDLHEVVRARGPLAHGEEVGGRCRMRHADGTYRWMEARVRPLPDADGSFTNRSLSSWRNVDVEVAALTELRESEERYRLLVEHVTDGVVLERDGRVVWASPNLDGLLGWDTERWIGLPVSELVGPDHRFELERAMAVDAPNEVRTMRLEVPDSDGDRHWIEVQARPFIAADGQRQGTACTVRLIDAEIEAELELEHRARHDQLTGLLNRKEIIDRLDAIGTDGRRPGNGSAVLFCDLDDFKAVNDTYGHAVGDRVLKEIATRVRSSIRDGDLVARIGGDEMLVVLHHLHGVDEAVAIADEIRRGIALPIGGPRGPLSVTMSIGVTMVVAGDTADAVIARADEAMYRAKAAGRDEVHTLPSGHDRP